MIYCKRFRWFASIVSGFLLFAFTAVGQIIEDPERTRATIINPIAPSQNDLVSLTGPGCFVSGLVHVEIAGTEWVGVITQLLIDGKTVVDATFGDAVGFGDYGIRVTDALVGNHAMSIAFQQPLFFNESLLLRGILPNGGVFTEMNGQVLAGVCRESGPPRGAQGR